MILEFQRMIGWKYEWGGAREGCVDCSGAFAYAYKRLGGFMYHGSNTMWRRYTTAKGKLGEIELLPGMAVFKRKTEGAPDSLGNFYHVGLYIGGGRVIEAQSAATGVVTSAVSKWRYAARLKDTVYDLKEGDEPKIEVQCRARVVTAQGSLNLRAAAPNGKILARVPQNAEVDVTRWDAVPGWAAILYEGTQGYASQEFLARLEDKPEPQTGKACELRLPFAGQAAAESLLEALRAALNGARIIPGGE